MIDTPWHQQSKEASFLRSALTTENRFQSKDEFKHWFNNRINENHFAVTEIPFAEFDNWHFVQDPYRLAHRSGKFFSVEGIRVTTNYGPISSWDQPIINQPEIGILGIVTRVFDGVRYFLMQAKMEPGNINIIQLSPTVQATKSNYTKVHQGKYPPYLEYFIDRDRGRILVDQLQSEQGSRFLQKRNRNMVVDVAEDIPIHDDFRWLTLGEIKELLTIDNMVNMDSRTVVSCLPFAHKDWGFYYLAHMQATSEHVSVFDYKLRGFPKRLFLSMINRYGAKHSLDEIISWFTELKTHYELSIEQIPLNEVKYWKQTDYEICHEAGRYFSVVAVKVEAGNREVTSWTQPLLKHKGYGIIGFLTQEINGTLHFLVRAVLEPGIRDLIEMGATVDYSEPEWRSTQTQASFLEFFINPSPEQIRFSAIQSEEGGRFYNFQSRYMILELPEGTINELPQDFIWLTLGQIIDFTKYSYFNIAARNLLSCLNLLKP